MFYKKCNKCTNKTCLKTHRICKSMNKWLRKYVEHKPYKDRVLMPHQLAFYEFLTQGLDIKDVVEDY